MGQNVCFLHDFDSFHKCQNLDTCYNGTFFHDIVPLCCSLYTKHYCRPRSWAVLQTTRPCCRRTVSTYMTNDNVSCICFGPYRSKIRSIKNVDKIDAVPFNLIDTVIIAKWHSNNYLMDILLQTTKKSLVYSYNILCCKYIQLCMIVCTEIVSRLQQKYCFMLLLVCKQAFTL